MGKYEFVGKKELERMDVDGLKKQYGKTYGELYHGEVSLNGIHDDRELLIGSILECQDILTMLRKSPEKRKTLETHAGDCSIYSSLINGQPKDGICNCGYGLELSRDEDYSEMYSEELSERIKLQNRRVEESNDDIPK